MSERRRIDRERAEYARACIRLATAGSGGRTLGRRLGTHPGYDPTQSAFVTLAADDPTRAELLRRAAALAHSCEIARMIDAESRANAIACAGEAGRALALQHRELASAETEAGDFADRFAQTQQRMRDLVETRLRGSHDESPEARCLDRAFRSMQAAL